MRFQDELTQSFRASRDVEPRRYVLRQIGDLALSVDFDEVVALLQAEEAAGPLSALATTALTRLLPRWLAAAHGAAEPEESHASWVAVLARSSAKRGPCRPRAADETSLPLRFVGGDLTGPVLPPAARGPVSDTWASVASHRLGDCVDPLIAAARSGEPAARRALARLLHPKAREGLREAAATDGAAAVALASTGDPDALPDVLTALRRDAAVRPELVRLLERFPGLDAMREVRANLRATEWELRIGAAMAVEGLGEHDPMGLAKPLLETWTDRWPLVQLADSLGRAAGPAAVPELIRLYQRSNDVLVRVAAVRSIANLGGPAAASFCHEVLDTGSHPVKAIAIGALSRLGDPADLRDRLSELSGSLHARLALTAAIALAAVDADEPARRAVAWLRDADPVMRQQGAFLLGYLPSPTALKVASRLAQADASVAVRLELLRTMAKYPAAQAGAALAACLDVPDPAVRARAVRLRALAGDLKPAELASLWRARLAREQDQGVRVELVVQLGLSGDASAFDALAEATRDPDERVAGAAALAIGATGAPALTAALGSSARAAVARFALGDARAFSACRDLLARDAAEGARAIEEILLLAPRLPASPRHLTLRQLLTGDLHSPAYEEFARARMGLRPPAARAFADVMSQEVRVAHAASAARLLAELETPGGRAPGASGRIPRPVPPPAPGWSLVQTLVALVLASACMVFLMMRELAKPRGAPTGTASAMAPGAVDGVIALDGDRPLKVPGTLTAEDRPLAFAARVRQNRLTLAPRGRLTLSKLETTGPASYVLHAHDLTGTLTVNATFGQPLLKLDLGDGVVQAGRAVMKVEARETGFSVKVAWGEARVGATVVKEGQGWTFERGKPPSAPGNLDMTRESWK